MISPIVSLQSCLLDQGNEKEFDCIAGLNCKALKPEKLGSNYLMALAQYASTKVDYHTGELFVADEEMAIVNKCQKADVLVQTELRVNHF
jgi:hypothetical protein